MSLSSGRIEEDILTLERQVWQLPDLAERLKRLVALEQQLAASWMFAGTGQGPPVVCNTIPGCPTTCLPDTLYIHDTVYGSITILRDDAFVCQDGTVGGWVGCKQVSFAGWGATCFAANPVAVWYVLTDSGKFQMQWVYNGISSAKCPIVSACADTPNATAITAGQVTIDTCSPFAAHTLIGVVGFVPYGNAQSGGVTVNFADTPI